MTTDHFDPYHKWLGIPRWEQPPNHYRLLGLTAYESDRDAIESAADQRMAHVRTFQSGEHSAESQRLLNELALARLCLLDAERKRAYDTELMAKQKSPLVPVAAKWPTVIPQHAEPEPIAVAPAEKRRRPKIRLPETSHGESIATKELLLAAALVAAGLIAFVFYKLADHREVEYAENVAEVGSPPTKAPVPGRESTEPSDKSVSPEGAVAPPEITPTETAADEGTAGYQRQPTVTAAGPIDPDEAAAANLLNRAVAWYRAEGDAADSIGMTHGTLNGGVKFAPGIVGKAFRFNGSDGNVQFNGPFIFNRARDATLTLCLRLPPAANGHFSLIWGRASNSNSSGFHIYANTGGLLGMDYLSPSGSLHSLFSEVSVGTAEFVNVAFVRTTGIYSLYVNGERKAVATDDAPQLPTSDSWRLSGREGWPPFIGDIDEIATFDRALSSAEIEGLSRFYAARRNALAMKVAPPHELSQDQLSLLERHVNSRTIDLLPLIDPNRDASSGIWLKDDQGLHSAADSLLEALRLPVAVPDEYCLTVAAERPMGWTGEYACLSAGLVGPRGQFVATIDWDGKAGLGLIDGKAENDNESTVDCREEILDGRPSVISGSRIK